MSLRLTLLNLYYRHVERRYLARETDNARMRQRIERTARRRLREPADTHVHPVRIPGPAGAIEALWISTGTPRRDRVILLLHGGAYLFGSPVSHRALAAALAARTGARVLVPDYRLAPEHPFPAAIEDAAACHAYLLSLGHGAGGIAFAGDSAGGGLALALLHLCGTAELPYPACAVAFSPWTDLTLAADSHRRNARREVLLPVHRIHEARDQYLGDSPADDPRASPVFGRFEGAPPVLIQASRAEILEDDARIMAARLSAQGVDVQIDFWERTPHCWQHLHGLLPEADAAMDAAGAFLRRHLDAEALETAAPSR